MDGFIINPIGYVQNSGEEVAVVLKPQYANALQELDGFSHIQVLWWASDFDTAEARSTLQTSSPYKGSPAEMGIFATRSPLRPNPIALSTVQVLYIEYDKGIVHLPYMDANDNTPVLDIKPYTPSLDRVESPRVPTWCAHWPTSLEGSASFDWEGQFNF